MSDLVVGALVAYFFGAVVGVAIGIWLGRVRLAGADREIQWLTDEFNGQENGRS